VYLFYKRSLSFALKLLNVEIMQSSRHSIFHNIDLLLDLNKVTLIPDENRTLKYVRTELKDLRLPDDDNVRNLLSNLNSFLEDYVSMHTGKIHNHLAYTKSYAC